MSLSSHQLEELVAKITQLDGAVNALTQQNQQYEAKIHQLENQSAPCPSGPDPFRIPDPIRDLPVFDGNKKQLANWLTTAKRTLALFQPIVTEAQYRIYLQSVIHKITGAARDVICVADELSTFEEVETLLTEKLGDRRDIASYKTALWQLKMGDSIHTYYQQTSEIVQNIKSLARKNQIYRDNWQAIEQFIEEDALASFVTGLTKEFFGHCQSAKPKDFKSAYSFLCKFDTNLEIRARSQKPMAVSNFKPQPPKTPFTPKIFPPKNIPFPTRSVNTPTPMEIDQSRQTRRITNNNIESQDDVNHDICEETLTENEHEEEFSVEFNSLTTQDFQEVVETTNPT